MTTIIEHDVAYRHGEVAFRGHLARPCGPAVDGGVLLFPDIRGVGEGIRWRARQIAQRGYAVLAADLHGEDSVVSDREQAQARAATLRQDPALLLARINAALAALRAQPGVLPERVAAAGFCFGGSAALHLARSGADILGAASFHGRLRTTTPAAPDAIRAEILVLHGGADPSIPPSEVAAFAEEMLAAKARWRLAVYGRAVHAFTDPAAAEPGRALYDPDAERRSFAEFHGFLDDLFHPRPAGA